LTNGNRAGKTHPLAVTGGGFRRASERTKGGSHSGDGIPGSPSARFGRVEDTAMRYATLILAASTLLAGGQAMAGTILGQLWLGNPNVSSDFPASAALIANQPSRVPDAQFNTSALAYNSNLSGYTIGSYLNNPAFFSTSSGFSPSASLNNTYFLFSGSLYLNAGTNNLTITHDDGFELSIPGAGIDIRHPSDTTSVSALTVNATTTGNYKFTLAYGEIGGPPARLLVNVNGAAIPLMPSRSSNLIYNGSFELGNTGFTTGYTLSSGNLFPETTYDLVQDAHDSHPLVGADYGDHTTGTGLMMAVNGATSPNAIVWSQIVAVDPNTDYNFSTWISNWSSTRSNPALLAFLFNGTSVGTFGEPIPAGVWEPFITTWNSGTNTSVVISIIDLNTVAFGYPFTVLHWLRWRPPCHLVRSS
jgi:hypothetical protein